MAQKEHDLVVRGGLVADGRGGEPIAADVAVDAGTITLVGTVPGRGTEEIDASGLLVTPGFVDIHTHYDGQATWDRRITPSSWHGVTTAVMGNCGVGFAPVRPDAHNRLISLMEGVEDIPGAVLDEGIDWSWESFGEYLDAVERRPHDIDLCAQLPHGALRLYVMGERAARLEEATAEDTAAMRSLATDAMRAGAIGFSTSRTLNHRTATGDPTPSLRAGADELEAIALGVADAGHGVVELISDFWPDTDGEFELMRTMVARTGVPLSLSLAQSHRRPEAWRELLARIEAAVAEGLPIRAQVAPRPVGLLVGLQSSYHPLLALPAYGEVAALPVAGQARALRDPACRARLLAELGAGDGGRRRPIDYGRLYPLGEVPDYEPAPETSLLRLAAARGVDPAALLLDLLSENDGRNFLYTPFSNYADGNLDACGEMLAHPDTVFGLGDGGAHVGLISDASFPTYALSHWGRDRSARSPGGGPDRGAADQCDGPRCRARRPRRPGRGHAGGRQRHRLRPPAPARRRSWPTTCPPGASGSCRGRGATAPRSWPASVTYRDGEPTGALPGRLVRGTRHGRDATGLVTTEHRAPLEPGGADMNARTLHELEPAAEWRAGDVADPASWTLRLDAADHAELDAALAVAKSKSADPLAARARRLPPRRPGRQAPGRRRCAPERARLRPHRHPRDVALRRRRPHAPLLGHRPAPRRAVGPEQARPRARRRHRPGQDDRRSDGARQRARRRRARLPHRRLRPGRPALPAHGP